MIFDVKTDRTKLTSESYKLPASFDIANDQPFVKGEFVTINGDEIARITGSSVVAHHNTFPIDTGSKRHDVTFSGKVTVIKGSFVFVTNNYDGNVTKNSLLTVKGDGDSTQARGELGVASSTQPIRGICEDVDAAAGTITVRWLDGGAVAA